VLLRPYQDVEFLLEKEDWHWAAAWSGPGGATPLHLAVLSLNVAVAEALLEVSSVNVNAIDERGETPLDQLARWDEALSQVGGFWNTLAFGTPIPIYNPENQGHVIN